ncbi:hypothetical protein [Oceanobacillus oncorhynchi]|uniref:hypothetical protein n=1 Tax=Oceanobacillus oncorhynchi TaxID=545501 RepID=UPI0025A35A6B|nr:hypothetical protein [Oceanobacillus oncorhynchi]MDM8102793.1 hypothetical protein [Oceanobacillus oncorhynchi]
MINGYPHITRYNYLKIHDIDNRDVQSGRKRTFNVNRMIWERDIYQKNKQQLKVIYEQPSYKIQKLDYEEYILFFIRENSPVRNNLFWVNTLPKGTSYKNHEDESIMTYRLGEWNKGKSVNINDQVYNALHTGHAFTEYNKVTLKSEESFWDAFKKSLQSQDEDSRFKYSVFKSFIIVFKYLG